MGKRTRVQARAAQSADSGSGGPAQTGPREPCPCGSGRRYKNCHGGKDGGASPYVRRPFEGLAGECDLVALREFVPAATAPLTVKDTDREVLLCSLLPAAAPALVRPDGSVWLGLQVQHAYGDASRDLAAVLARALEAEPGSMVGLPADPGPGPRLQDLMEGGLDVTVHDGFDFWVADVDQDGSMAAALEQANAAAAPTQRLDGDRAAYLTTIGDHAYLRWVMPEDEDALLDALARLHHAGEDRLVEGARLIGMFRAHGLLVPVWDVPVAPDGDRTVDADAAALAGPVDRFAERLAAVLGAAEPLSADERSTRAGLASRQLTLR
ncbi:MAG TPA: DUF5926 family protein [Marmoricola sp.]|nr:DUF5926 family protein [Marmoricola sp.]